MISKLFHVFLALGTEWILWILIAATLAALTVFLERWRNLRGQERVGALLWKEQLSRWVLEGPPLGWEKSAQDWAASYPCPETRLLLALSGRQGTSPESLERITQSVLSAERLQLDKYLAILGTLGNSAPFIGLFGTVLGIIKAFSELGNANGNGGLAAISGGLAEALVTTATGLVVAIPSAMAYNYFQRKIKAINGRSLALASRVVGDRN